MKFSIRNIVFTFISVTLMVVIFWFSSKDATVSTEQSDFFINVFMRWLFDSEIPYWLSVAVRKLAHFSAYAALGFSFYNAVYGPLGRTKTGVFSFCASALYSVSDEVHQAFVPGRACRLLDVFIDGCGSLFGIILAVLIFRLFADRRKGSGESYEI